MSVQVHTRPRRLPDGQRLAQLRAALRRRDVVDNAVALEEELEARRLDARLSSAGYAVRRRQRWPRERSVAEATGQVLRRGPEVWGDRVRAHVR